MKIDERQRLYFLDNIKVFLTILVIIHHVGQAYGPTGGFWQYKSSLAESIPFLGRFFGINAGFFMGFFFLISGYFFPGSFDKNNGKDFVKKRLIKFGIPLLIIFFIMQPLQMFFYYASYSGNTPMTFFRYYTDIWLGLKGMPSGFISVIGFPEMNFGHAWFIEHLLVYSILYWIVRKTFRNRTIKQENATLSAWSLFIIAIIISVLSFVVRIWFPKDDWRGIFGFFQVEIAHWPQYLVMFITGIIAYRKNWIFTLQTKIGYSVLLIALLMVVIVYCGVPVWNIWAVYESFFAVLISWGLITLFREEFNKTTPFLNKLSRGSYAAYLIHFPIVLITQYALDKVIIGGPVGKFVVVSILSVLISYAISCLLVKVKYINKVL